MAIDWGFAGQVSGVGFGIVFSLLVILAIVIWLTRLIVSKIGAGEGETGDKEKGD